MAHGPVRRAHLIGQSGVGGLTVLPGGVSVITGALDHWFTDASDRDEFKIDDWRLEQRLHVDHFRLPPDHRAPRKGVPNIGLTVPGYRFPRWHTCTVCHRLVERDNPFEQKRLTCRDCASEEKRRAPFLDQVLIVACCENGHIQDFPWHEWVHKSLNPSCSGRLTLDSKSGVGLSAFTVRCDKCSAYRNLAGVQETGALTRDLDPSLKGGYVCQGSRAWVSPDGEYEACGLPLTGMIRNASNTYFPRVYSSLHLPLADTRPVERILDLFAGSPLKEEVEEGTSAERLKRIFIQLREFEISDIETALNTAREVLVEGQVPRLDSGPVDSELRYRLVEHGELSRNQDSEFLVVRHKSPVDYGIRMNNHFRSIALLPTLRETRVQSGFSRIVAGGASVNPQAMLWQHFPPNPKDRWLPGYRVYGEGILFQFDESQLTRWESSPAVRGRLSQLNDDLKMPVNCTGMEIHPSARLYLVHSFAHAMLREFVTSCGYSAAALRERLFISDSKKDPMASVLIYTASGDSAGSMGGLVRLGEPEHLGPLIDRALRRALWCAADPVCVEAVPETTTSTRELANLAACHNCMYVPETSCEEFNGLLDRAMLVGTDEEPELGYFAQLVR